MTVGPTGVRLEHATVKWVGMLFWRPEKIVRSEVIRLLNMV